MGIETDIRNFLSGRGSTRSSRYDPALNPEFFSIEDHSEAEMLHFVSEFSKLLVYYNEDNQADGDWQIFFRSDSSIFIASMINTYLAVYADEKERIMGRKSDGSKEDEFRRSLDALKLIARLATQLADWFEFMPEDDHDGHKLGFKEYIHTYYKSKLGPMMDWMAGQFENFRDFVLSHPEILAEGDTPEAVVQPLERLHAIITMGDIGMLKNLFPELQEIATQNEADLILTFVFSNMYTAAQHIRLSAPSYLEKAAVSPDHQPHVALLLTFFKLLAVVRDSLNGLTRRHLDYFYETVLRIRPRDRQPDKVHLLFSLQPDARRLLLPEGSEVIAGNDESGREIVFTTDMALVLNQIKVRSLRTIFNSGVPTQEPRYVYASPIADSADGAGQPFTGLSNAWPSFGESQYLKAPSEVTMQPARIGFAVADAVLNLESGDRLVQFRFQFAQGTQEELMRQISIINTGHGNEEFIRKFERLFAEPFIVKYTGPEGWVNVPRSSMKAPVFQFPLQDTSGNSSLTFSYQLSDEFPPIVPADAALHGEQYAAGLPVFEFELNHQNTVYAYMPLRHPEVRAVEIITRVNGLRNVSLANDQGPLDGSKPFLPFGTSPVVGSSFYIGSREVFSKKVKQLRVKIEWLGLPDDGRGLAGYYEEYAETDPQHPWHNQSYKVKPSFLSAYQWLPAMEARQEFFLFSSRGKEAPLDATTVMDGIDAAFLKPEFLAPSEEPLLLQPQTRSGFFKLELSSPSRAFGHGFYNKVISRVVNENAEAFLKKMKRFRRKDEEPPKATPNPPFNPTAKSVTLDYEAVATLRPGIEGENVSGPRSCFYHLHPFGVTEAKPEEGNAFPSMVPHYNHQGCLFIGLDEVVLPSQLSLLVQAPEGTGNPDEEPPVIVWSYWAQDKWLPFRPEEMLVDSTKGFLQPGVIVFQLPTGMSRGCGALDNHEFGEGLWWIRGSVTRGAAALSRVTLLATQAVSATYAEHKGGQRNPGQVLPAHSVKRLKEPVQGVAGVQQPFPSFGGQAPEPRPDYYARVSERLRHKGRAISDWDIKMLVLERFPEVYKVKVLNHIEGRNWIAPGKVTLVVIPRISGEEAKDRREPRGSLALLKDIRRFLGSVSSPFASIRVRFPSYQYLVVRVKVRFTHERDPGVCLEELNRALFDFLTPWNEQFSSDIAIGGKVYKSAIHDFINKQSYVEEVRNLRLFQIIRGGDSEFANRRGDTRQLIEIPDGRDDAMATRPWAVLTSVRRHRIEVIQNSENNSAKKAKGVEDMTIGEDFQVNQLFAEEADPAGINHMVIISKEAAERMKTANGPRGNCLRIKSKIE